MWAWVEIQIKTAEIHHLEPMSLQVEAPVPHTPTELMRAMEHLVVVVLE
jgi:hypothetical protein